MQVTETLNEGLKRAYTLMLTAQELDDEVNRKLAEAQPGVALKGFRKGKVPMALMRKQFGKQVLGEALQEAIDSAVKRHFEEQGHRPAQQPDMRMTKDDWKEGDDVEVALSYERLPDVPATDFAAISLEKLTLEPGDADIEDALAGLAKNAQTFADRPEGAAAEEGDQVAIDFVGKLDGVPFEGGAGEDYPLALGSGSFIPGFEEQLVGAKAGERRDVTVTFPAEYGAAHLAGREAVFEVTVKAVKAPEAAVIDDALAQQYGEESLDALKTKVRERLAAEYGAAARQVLKRRLLDALDAAVSFDLPEGLVEAEASQIAHQLWHDENPDHHGHDHDAIEVTDEHRALAVRRVKLGLLLAETGTRAEIEVTDQEMTRAVIAEARKYPGQEQEFFRFVQQNPGVQQQLRAPVFEDKVVDYILELAKVEERAVSKDELQKAIEALDES